MAKRVLVLSAAVGAGHLRAAQAVELALKQLDPEAVVKNVDVLELTNAAFRRVYAKAYLDLVNKAPHVLGYFYDLMDRPVSPRRTSDRLRLMAEKLNLRPFLRFLKSEPWDVIVNTHFLPPELIASLRRQGKLATPHLTVTTDFETHRLWVNQPCDHYFSATSEGAAYLRHWGVPPGDISVTGIPIHPVFSQPKDRAECLKRQGLLGDRPIVVQISGGFGVGPIEEIFRGILAIEVPIEIVVITGRNETAQHQLEAIVAPERHRVKILGFTDQIDELMAVADLVVSKPGGLTTSEILARGAAMAVVNPIPGQESRNSDFLLEKGAAVKINNIATLAHKLTPLLEDPARLARLKENAKRIGKPQAAFDIARRALAWPATHSTVPTTPGRTSDGNR
ncbi:MAG TPA: glycosyltransferase [Planctomycetaceae bacterium]|jgi:processive 1,2-diacylglycerol beta-glucosyltransferase|nr:glycosyltransferase [Planctomycetaceae bacterium]